MQKVQFELGSLQSEKQVTQSPISFTGSAKRIWGWSEKTIVRLLLLIPLIVLAWGFVAAWYACVFGFLWVIAFPYRIMRRNQRKRKVEDLRQRELIAAVMSQKQG